MSIALTKCNVCRRLFKSIRNHIRQSDCHLTPNNLVISVPTTRTTRTVVVSHSQRYRDDNSADSSVDCVLEQEVEEQQDSSCHDPYDAGNNEDMFDINLEPKEDSAVNEDIANFPVPPASVDDISNQAAVATAGSHMQPSSTNHVFPQPNTAAVVPIQQSGYQLFSRQELSLLRIMNECDEAGVPRYFFDDLIEKIRYEMLSNGFDPRNKCPVRNTLLRRLAKQCPTPAPVAIPVALENDSSLYTPLEYKRGERDVVFVQTFDFEQQVVDLISTDEIFAHLENLDVNTSNPFAKFERSDGRVDEVNSASWYQHAYDQLVTDPENEFLFPIIIYLDKTGTDALQRHGLEPVLFTTSVINRKTRQWHHAWRPLGYIPDLQAKSSAAKAMDSSSRKSTGRSTRHYHACLDVVLDSLVTAQKKGIFVSLRLGSLVKLVRLVVPVAFVVGDAKSGDMLCGRYGNYNTSRISRACDSSSTNCCNTQLRCSYILQSEMERLSNLALMKKGNNHDDQQTVPLAQIQAAESRLHELSSHVVRNAFHRINFGNDPRGIYGCTPTDLMHAFLEGVLKYCMGIIFEPLTPRLKAQLDKIVDRCFACNRNSRRRFFPRTNFKKGFTNLTLLTACEWEGVCFTIMILVMMKSASFFVDAIEDHLCTFADLMELLEALLTFHAWCKCRESFACSSSDDVEDIRHSIATMLEMIKSRLPRNAGNGWDLQKFHELLHIPDDLFRFGSPRNTDAGPGERSLKDFAKKPARTSQKTNDGFLDQVTSRIHERAMFEKAKRLTDPLCLWGGESIHEEEQYPSSGQPTRNPSLTPSSNLVGKPRFRIMFSNTGYAGNEGLSSSKTKGLVELHPIVLNWFIADQNKRGYICNVDIWTEYKRDKICFRAHPNYRSAGPWHDWVMIRWDATENDDNNDDSTMDSSSNCSTPTDREGWYSSSEFLSKILCFYQDPIHHNICALIHSCNERSNDDEDSLLCQIWYLEYRTTKVTADGNFTMMSSYPSNLHDDGSNRNPQLRKRQKQQRTTVNVALPAIYDVPVDAFVDPIFVVEENPGLHKYLDPDELDVSSRCIAIKKRQEFWGQHFSSS